MWKFFEINWILRLRGSELMEREDGEWFVEQWRQWPFAKWVLVNQRRRRHWWWWWWYIYYGEVYVCLHGFAYFLGKLFLAGEFFPSKLVLFFLSNIFFCFLQFFQKKISIFFSNLFFKFFSKFFFQNFFQNLF